MPSQKKIVNGNQPIVKEGKSKSKNLILIIEVLGFVSFLIFIVLNYYFEFFT